jgi:hypothetical protein
MFRRLVLLVAITATTSTHAWAQQATILSRTAIGRSASVQGVTVGKMLTPGFTYASIDALCQRLADFVAAANGVSAAASEKSQTEASTELANLLKDGTAVYVLGAARVRCSVDPADAFNGGHYVRSLAQVKVTDARSHLNGKTVWIATDYIRDFSDLHSTTSATPAPSANQSAAAVVQNYYSLWNKRDFASMYALLSKHYQSRLSYATYPKYHSLTDSISVVATPGSTPAEVRIRIHSIDHDGHGNISNSNFEGTWYLVWEDGRWKLNKEDLREITSP